MHTIAKKYFLVIFVTLLVWVWANNAMEEALEISAAITTAQTGDSEIFTTFDGPVPLNLTIKVKGPSSKIANLETLMAAGQENLEFVYSRQSELEDESETYPLDTVKWLNQTVKIKSLGLSVETAKPEMIQVTVEKLVKKELAIECFDEDGIMMIPDSLNPPTVNVFIKEGWVGTARIDLSAMEVEKAQKDYVTKKPYVQLNSGDFRYGDLVTVKLPSTELDTVTYQPRNILFAFSENLQGKYRVELVNESDLAGSSTLFKGSPEAIEAYKNSPVHIIVQVFDGDEDEADVITRDVIYNFPPEYFAKGKIMLAKPPVKARFKLIPLAPPVIP